MTTTTDDLLRAMAEDIATEMLGREYVLSYAMAGIIARTVLHTLVERIPPHEATFIRKLKIWHKANRPKENN